MEMHDKSKRCPYDLDDKSIVSTERPLFESDIKYVYEIDLDRNIFHINDIPFFTLECLPSVNVFLKYVTEGHYRNVACAAGCPSEHMYKRPALPVVDDSEFATYQSLVCTGTHVALSDLLSISDVISPGKHVRASLLEAMIGQCMVREHGISNLGDVRRVIVRTISQFGLVSHNNQITDQEWSTASFMANLAFIPHIFDYSDLISNYPKPSRNEFTWVREDTVVRIAIHLDDERCLLASISRLIDEILEQKGNPGDYFGVAFSISHCAIVKVVRDTHATTFSHTGTLQFLPSSFAESPSTPGIIALARLSYRVDPTLFEQIYRRMKPIVNTRQSEKRRGYADTTKSLTDDAEDTPPQTSSSVLPPELWREICFNLHLHDLIAFGLVSKLCVASIVLRYPQICSYRLVGVPNERLNHLQKDYRFLRAASFFAVRSGIPAILIVGLGSSGMIKITSDIDDSSLSVRFSAYPDPMPNLIGDSDTYNCSSSSWGVGV
ncbi:hypothetical protein K503DRAFT_772995 [Rhizopogon vinicolor AM-OR11-026]|uniref:F-box domain-containing protein n=1 Tax=Rhizopogon vinicolor AM-OR11-026 TaxID=1314800 RepID=A0A1B7MTI3_9AGAM|nr:hypothetical protein K503DRAFT_772995 [Rhizopogon vinicolor AM-OR11-026]